ncbi:MAG: hypothetical protein KIT33_06360 [Candidatus Kapabacteria bacterium]|nr:hypothetical protein [Ignavibacteriota bacterium]MCW5884577.1 hypothetical protein [Candidatus Kapabacteria bacterium]
MIRQSVNMMLIYEDSQIADVYLFGLNLPKSRSSKINQFKHYTTDAPV